MRIRSIFTAIALLAGLMTPAFAADEIEQAAFEARWTGFYAGVVGGYFASSLTQQGCVGACPVNPRYDALGIGVQAGYDHQFTNNLVLGAYARVMLAGQPVTVTATGFGAAFPFTVQPRFAGAVGARLGYAVGNFLPYAAVGYTGASVRASAQAFPATTTVTHHGVHVSAGLEALVTENISVDFRYTYTHFGRAAYNFGGGATNYGANANNFTAALNYRF